MKCNIPGKYDAKNLSQKYGKNADPRLIEIAENLDKMKIGVDDTFEFGCRACGKCCRNRTDIIVSPRDIYNIAKRHALHNTAYIMISIVTNARHIEMQIYFRISLYSRFHFWNPRLPL